MNDNFINETQNDAPPVALSPDVLKSLRAAKTEKEKYAIVRTQWAPCVAQPTLRGLGQYPTDAWNKFLQDYGIKETYKEKGPD